VIIAAQTGKAAEDGSRGTMMFLGRQFRLAQERMTRPSSVSSTAAWLKLLQIFVGRGSLPFRSRDGLPWRVQSGQQDG
jgi:hypothetical protein